MYEAVTWMFGVGVVVSFLVAYGVGANDVANTFAPSVAAKALTMRQALLVAAIFEFTGAVLMGAGVADTVRSGITNLDYFVGRPDVLAYGMLCALAAVGVWMLIATYLELPVSSTQAIVASIAGMAIVAQGWNAVVWSAPMSSFPYLKGMSAIALSWLFSPILAGAFSALLFVAIRALILRSPNAYRRALAVLPILVLVTSFVVTMFIFAKGGLAYNLQAVPDAKKAWISAIVAAGCCLIATAIGIPLLRRNVQRDCDAADAAAAAKPPATSDASIIIKDTEAGGVDAPSTTTATSDARRPAVVLTAAAGGGSTGTVATADGAPVAGWRAVRAALQSSTIWRALNYGMNYKLDTVLEEDASVADMHAAAEKFDPKGEACFKYLQVCTACANAFAHGSNEVANAVGPLAAIFLVWQTGGVAAKNPVPHWLLAFGGVGICAGLATFGFFVMRSLGMRMTRLSNSRGFCIELSVAAVIILASRFNIPMSSTPATVGAIAGVGLLEGRSGFNGRLLLKCVCGWVVTIIAAVALTCAFMAQGLAAPSRSCPAAAAVKV